MGRDAHRLHRDIRVVSHELLTKANFSDYLFFIARQCIRLKLRVASTDRRVQCFVLYSLQRPCLCVDCSWINVLWCGGDGNVCNKRNWKDILNSLQNYHLFRHKRPARVFKNSLDTLWQEHSFFNGLSQAGAYFYRDLNRSCYNIGEQIPPSALTTKL